LVPLRAFDALERQLAELRRSLGDSTLPVLAPEPEPEPVGDLQGTVEEPLDPAFDEVSAAAPPSAVASTTVLPETVAPEATVLAAPRGRGPFPWDLLALAGAWAGLIVLVVTVLERAG